MDQCEVGGCKKAPGADSEGDLLTYKNLSIQFIGILDEWMIRRAIRTPMFPEKVTSLNSGKPFDGNCIPEAII
jgi:hypothetical protein